MNIVNNVYIKAGYVERRDEPLHALVEYHIGQYIKYISKHHEYKGYISEIQNNIVTLNDNGCISVLDFDMIEPVIINPPSNIDITNSQYVTIPENNFRLAQDSTSFGIGEDVLLTVAHKGIYDRAVTISSIENDIGNNQITIMFSKIGDKNIKYELVYNRCLKPYCSEKFIVCEDAYIRSATQLF